MRLLLLVWLSLESLLRTTSAQDMNSTVVSAGVSTSIVIQYTSINAPSCPDEYLNSLNSLQAANANILDQCVTDASQYSLFPYSGLLPTDKQLAAMVSSLACLRFFQGVLLLSPGECNFGGIDLPSALETLLMTAQDVVAGAPPLASEQFAQFIAWRHERNAAREAGMPYDNTTESAVAFDSQLATTTVRLGVALTDTLQIQLNGVVIGTSKAKDEEIRSAGSDSWSERKETRVAPILHQQPANATGSSNDASSTVANHSPMWVVVALPGMLLASGLSTLL